MVQLMNKNFEIYWKNRFNDLAMKFEDDHDVGLWSERGFKQRYITFSNIFGDLSFNKSLKILDIGCGTGAYDRMLISAGHDVIGVDYSEYVVRKAIKKSSNKDNIQYLISAVPHLPFKESYFDVVVCIGVLQYVENEQKVIDDIDRMLKNDGIVIIEALNLLSVREIFKKLLALFAKDMQIKEKRYNPFKLKNIFSSFGNSNIIGIYLLPKRLIFLEKIFKHENIIKMLNKMYPLSLFVANAFFIKVARFENGKLNMENGESN